MKKESGKVVETSGEGDVVKPHATKEFQKAGVSPQRPKMTPKRGPKNKIL